MPGQANTALGNLANNFMFAVTIPAGAAMAAGPSVQERTYTVPGLRFGIDVPTVIKPTFTAAIGIVGARVSADNTLAITFLATAGTPSLPANEVYLVQVDRAGYDAQAQIPTGL